MEVPYLWSGMSEHAGILGVRVPPFSFLTNHGQTLLVIAHDPKVRMRDIAATVGITERAAQRIVSDLVETGYVSRTREGRRNSYTVDVAASLRTPLPRDVALGDLLGVLAEPAAPTA
jgi:DNA-binding IscR family transcriptional regulator